MARHNDTGKLGEELALRYLQEQGWEILEINWRLGRTEVDLIAKEKEVLVFVEVKTRRNDSYGTPEEAVGGGKMKRLTRACARYMERIGHDWEVRFDVISILLPEGREPRIDHLRDAFFPGI